MCSLSSDAARKRGVVLALAAKGSDRQRQADQAAMSCPVSPSARASLEKSRSRTDFGKMSLSLPPSAPCSRQPSPKPFFFENGRKRPIADVGQSCHPVYMSASAIRLAVSIAFMIQAASEAVAQQLPPPPRVATILAENSTTQSPPSSDVVNSAMDYYAKGRYLEASQQLADVAFDSSGKINDIFAFQMWQQISTAISNELDLKLLDRFNDFAPSDHKWDKAIANSAARDAIAEIVSRASSTSIVILNEAHSSPRDRAFAWRVAQALRPLGYSILAAETFDNEPRQGGKPTVVEQLTRDRFVRLSTGFYTRDPVYAAFLRNALAIGYQPLSYEQNATQRSVERLTRRQVIEAREQAQAENLAAIHRRVPAAKLLIYVGYSHVAEAPLSDQNGGEIEWMAARLKRLTGIDPLTIDQTIVTDRSFETRNSYNLAAAKVGSRDGVLFENGHPLVVGRYSGKVDLQIVHPQRAYRYGRPTWLADLGGAPLPVPSRYLPAVGHRLIQVFAKSAPSDAVPLDQLVISAGSRSSMLLSPTKDVRFVIQP